MDYAALANLAVKYLLPALPTLVSAGQKAAEKAAESIGSAAWDLAKSLWERVGLSQDKDSDAAKAAQQVAKNPEDERSQMRLSFELEKLFEKNQELANAVAEAIKSSPAGTTVIASGERSVGIGGNVTGSTIITGDQNKVGDQD